MNIFKKILGLFVLILKKILQEIIRAFRSIVFILFSFLITKMLNIIILVGLLLYAAHYFGIAPGFVNGIFANIKNQVQLLKDNF